MFFGIILVLNIPNMLPWERQIYPGTYILDLQERLLKCALIAPLFLALFARPVVAWSVSWLLFLWWLPASFATRWISDAPITANLVGMALASSPGELRNLALSMPVSLLWIFIGWNLFCAVVFFYLKKTPTRWSGKGRGKIFVVCSSLLLLPHVLNFSTDAAPVTQEVSRGPVDPFKEADRDIGPEAALPRAFPYELPWAVAQYLQARQVVAAAHSGLGSAPESQAFAVDATSPDVVVLVIGESSSRKAWRLFYPGQFGATPRMEARLAQGRGLYPFSNVVAQSTATRQAVPSMLTPQPLLWPDGSPNPQATKSIVSLASKSGYFSAWFSNQAAIGRYDGIIATYADEADTTAFLNPASFFQRGTQDEVLLPLLQRHLEKHAKSFVVLHTMGSHFRFDQRYPQGFGPFPDTAILEQTYLNSIAYTDAVLDQIIAALERDGRSAVMLYVSDHGQGLPDAECGKTDINRVTVDSYEVPALVWLSAAYEAAHPMVSQALRKNAQGAYTTAGVHQTLKDLVAGRVGGESIERPDEAISFLRYSRPDSPRTVIAPDFRTVSFNEAVARNSCFITAR